MSSVIAATRDIDPTVAAEIIMILLGGLGRTEELSVVDGSEFPVAEVVEVRWG